MCALAIKLSAVLRLGMDSLMRLSSSPRRQDAAIRRKRVDDINVILHEEVDEVCMLCIAIILLHIYEERNETQRVLETKLPLFIFVFILTTIS